MSHIVNLHEDIAHKSEAVEFKVEENDGSIDRRMLMRFIAPGISLNRTVYTAKNMEELKKLIDTGAKKMYENHTSGKYPRKVGEWVATIEDTFVKEDGLYGWILFRPTQKAKEIYETGKQVPKEVGASIDARAMISRMKNAGDGKPGVMIESIVGLRSVDFVTEAAAKGGIAENILTDEERNDLYGAMSDVLLRASVSENVNSDMLTALASVTESLGDRSFSTMITEADDDKDDSDDTPQFMKDFSKRMAADEKRREFYDIWWAFRDYIMALLGTDEVESDDEKMKLGNKAFEYVMKKGFAVPFDKLEESARIISEGMHGVPYNLDESDSDDNPLVVLVREAETFVSDIAGSLENMSG